MLAFQRRFLHFIVFYQQILAREWAKLRWGVYDEVARDPDRESYYHFTNREILPTICSASIQGQVVLHIHSTVIPTELQK